MGRADHSRDEREDKLPVWARILIGSMRSENEELRKIVDASTNPLSNTFIDSNSRGTIPEVGLGQSPRINFYFQRDRPRRRSVDCVQIYFDIKGELVVQGGDSLRVSPKATNSVTIELADRFKL